MLICRKVVPYYAPGVDRCSPSLVLEFKLLFNAVYVVVVVQPAGAAPTGARPMPPEVCGMLAGEMLGQYHVPRFT